jgi:hypothetical protein
MFNIFVKRIKISISNIKDKFTSFVKLVNISLIFNAIYFIIVYDCIAHFKDQSLFMLPFFDSLLTRFNPNNLSLFILVLFIISIKNIIQNYFYSTTSLKTTNTNYLMSSNASAFNYNSVYLYLLYITYNLNSMLININYLYFWLRTFITFNLKKLFLINFCIQYISHITKQISWYTVFKRHSFFGFYRVSRQRWTELKTEEINYLKY